MYMYQMGVGGGARPGKGQLSFGKLCYIAMLQNEQVSIY
jgi:hypothetical protein